MAIFRGVGGSGDSSDNSFLDEVTAQAQAAEASATAAANSATSALNTELTSASFNTSNGVLTLTKQDGDTVTTDLDGRFLLTETDPVFSAHAASGVTSTKITNWDTSYNDKINAVSFSSSNNTLTLTQQDGSTLTTVINGSLTGGGETLAQTLAIGNTTGGNDISFGDNDKAKFGAGNDLQIYHDGSHSYIADVGTGNLRIRGTDITLQDADGNGYISMVDGGAGGTVYLKHLGSDVLATTATGIDVTGTVTADGLTVDGEAYLGAEQANPVRINSSSAIGILEFNSTTGVVRADGTGQLLFETNGSTDRLKIANNGDISFYEDTGTTPKFFWDASAESLGIGTSSPQEKLHLQGGIIRVEEGSNTSFYEEDKIHSYASSGYTINGREGLTLETLSANKDIILSPTGNVGIGTSSPLQKLHVNGNVLFENNNEIRFKDSGATQRTAVALDSSNDLNIGTSAGGNLKFINGSSYTERMRIDSSGNVIVGGTTAQQTSAVTLTQGGSIINDGFIKPATDASYDIGSSSQRYKDLYLSGNVFTDEGFYGDRVWNEDNSNLRFATDNTERMRITSTGDIGIGTGSNSVERKLHVQGSGGTIAAKIEATDGNQSSLDLKNSEGEFRLINDGGELSVFDQTDNTERLRIDTTGKVGIGASNPATDLHVKNADATQLLIESGETSTGFLLFGDASDLNIGSVSYDHSNNSMRFETSDDERMRIDSSGNVGIGTDNPLSKLHVKSATSGTTPLSGTNLFIDDTGNNYLTRGSGTTGTGGVLFGDGGSNAAGFTQYNHANNSLSFGANGTERARINQYGSLGISTTNPIARLHVQQTTNSSGTTTTQGTTAFFDSSGNSFIGLGAGTNNNAGINFGDANDADVGSIYYSNAVNGMFFRTSAANRMMISSSGYVGIGAGAAISSPLGPLHLSKYGGSSGVTPESSNSLVIDDYTAGIQMSAPYYGASQICFGRGASSGVSADADRGKISYSNLTDYMEFKVNATEAMRITSSGYLGIGTSAPTELLDIDSDKIRIRDSNTPSSASSTGAKGEICYDSNYVYVCVATNTWKRAALGTW